jgi:hypothetical protein
MSFDPRPFAEHYRAENEAEQRVMCERAADALVEARSLAERIRQADSEIRAVILFGALAEGGPRRKKFDIDLALDGGISTRRLIPLKTPFSTWMWFVSTACRTIPVPASRREVWFFRGAFRTKPITKKPMPGAQSLPLRYAL